MKCHYKKGFKYQLARDYVGVIGFEIPRQVETQYIRLEPRPNGTCKIFIATGYAWDGPSGPTIDALSDSAMRPSLEHDALFELMRKELLPPKYKTPADIQFHNESVKDGMWRIRAWGWHRVLHQFGWWAASPGAKREVHSSPRS